MNTMNVSQADNAVLSQPDERDVVLFKCPGCGHCHGVWTNPAKPNEMTGAHWRWNGDRYKPTFEPSILSRGEHTCHSFVRDGKIQFLTDCTHAMAGQTVDLPIFILA